MRLDSHFEPVRRHWVAVAAGVACAVAQDGAGVTVELHLGDCLQILPNISEVDAIITDVPYGTTACKWDVIIPLDKMWEQVKRLCKGAFVTTASQPFTSVLIMSNLDWFKYELIWDKKSTADFLLAKKRPMKYHENLMVFSKNGHTYNPQMWKGIKNHSRGNLVHTSEFANFRNVSTPDYLDGMKYPRSILEFQKHVSTEADHPTQKPVALYEYLIKTYTNEGDTVLDFCMGSGTTGVACMNTGRNFIGIEKELPYFEIAEKRINQAQEARQLEPVA